MEASSTTWWLLPIILASAILHIQAEYAGARKRVYIFKPLTTSLIILLALLIQPPVSTLYKPLIVAGLVFSLAGDVFLMLPNDRFLYGLISFLVGHLAYTAAFVSIGGFRSDFLALGIYAMYGLIVLYLLWTGLGTLKAPVIVYVVVILGMGWQALAVWRANPSAGTLSAAVGAASFVLSDSVLALDRFRGGFSSARAIVLGSYFLAQVLIALSIVG